LLGFEQRRGACGSRSILGIQRQACSVKRDDSDQRTPFALSS
jgi:hypothetical protein